MTRSCLRNNSGSPPITNGFRTRTPMPSPQSQSFCQSCGSILPTSLVYIIPSNRGCSPWRPDVAMITIERGRHSALQIFKGHQNCTKHHVMCNALTATGPYLQLSRFQSGSGAGHASMEYLDAWCVSYVRHVRLGWIPAGEATT
ncbi:hypothetical protein T459_04144 [Capsicum annuum]|uniref:Uncharacterized protein n=1 Tax=Capsicum annuum TaxID=4072 RepID=A0A2G3A4B7_CAPAN|nr:hypothetical protein T459_04144 [Capsicum annuum]